jgi:hypothetical protein
MAPIRLATPGLAPPFIQSPVPGLDSRDYMMALAWIPALGWMIPFDISPSGGSAHEGHGGQGAPLALKATVGQTSFFPPAPFSGVPLFRPAPGLRDGIPISWSLGGALPDHGALDPATSPIATDFTGSSSVSYVPKKEAARDQSGPVKADAGVVLATVPIFDLVTRSYDLTFFPVSPLMGDRSMPAPVAVEWHEEPGWSYHQQGGGSKVDGEKCDGLGGTWVLDGTYEVVAGPSRQEGVQQWLVSIDERTLRGTFTLVDTATQDTGTGVIVYVTHRASGDASLQELDGQIHMTLDDRKHTSSATTTKGGQGNERNVPLQRNIFVWEPGAQCGP